MRARTIFKFKQEKELTTPEGVTSGQDAKTRSDTKFLGVCFSFTIQDAFRVTAKSILGDSPCLGDLVVYFFPSIQEGDFPATSTTIGEKKIAPAFFR